MENRRNKKNRLSKEYKKRMLFQNQEMIRLNGLFGDDYNLPIIPFERPTDYLSNLEDYLMCKDYDQLYEMTEREKISLRIMSNPYEIERLTASITTAFNEKSIQKYGHRGSKKWRDEFKDRSFTILMQFLQAFTNTIIKVPVKYVAHRDYNLLTKVNLEVIKVIADEYNIRVREIDIKAAFPRILYAVNGMELPEDFYGNKKENKVAVNVAINTVKYNSDNTTPKPQQRYRHKAKLIKFGFDEVVAEYIMENYFECDFKGDMFHFLAFHERRIIKNLKDAIDLRLTAGYGRRHDSLIIFEEDHIIDLNHLNDFEYLNQMGWFDIEDQRDTTLFENNSPF